MSRLHQLPKEVDNLTELVQAQASVIEELADTLNATKHALNELLTAAGKPALNLPDIDGQTVEFIDDEAEALGQQEAALQAQIDALKSQQAQLGSRLQTRGKELQAQQAAAKPPKQTSKVEQEPIAPPRQTSKVEQNTRQTSKRILVRPRAQ